MKINCHCGHTILDNTDGLPHKGHIIPDSQWFTLWEAIDAAVEQSGPSAQEKEAACMGLRQLPFFSSVWECTQCGRLHLFKQGELLSYAPEVGQYQAVLKPKS